MAPNNTLANRFEKKSARNQYRVFAHDWLADLGSN